MGLTLTSMYCTVSHVTGTCGSSVRVGLHFWVHGLGRLWHTELWRPREYSLEEMGVVCTSVDTFLNSKAEQHASVLWLACPCCIQVDFCCPYLLSYTQSPGGCVTVGHAGTS